jgi:hypothetical protein
MAKKASGTDGVVLKRRKDILSRKDQDGTVAVLGLENEKFFHTLNGIAAEVWGLIDGKRSLGEIKKALIKKYDPPIDRFSKDVDKLIKDLKKEKLLL